jgi:hypothetical protein
MEPVSWIAIVQRYWKPLLFISSLFLLYFYISGIKNDLKERDDTIVLLQSEKRNDELQKDALRKAILDQNEAVEKQRIDAVERAEVFRVKSESINAKYERERAKVIDLNGTKECDAIREIIKSAV